MFYICRLDKEKFYLQLKLVTIKLPENDNVLVERGYLMSTDSLSLIYLSSPQLCLTSIRDFAFIFVKNTT